MVLKIYIDHASQPSRAVYAFCLLLKIPHQVHELRVIEGDHLKEDYVKINPLKMVPSIDDDGFYLGQSHAILKYLAKKYSKTDNWYPTNNYKKCAIVDEYLAFHSNNTRQCAKLTFLTGFAKYIDKRRSNFQVAHYEKKTVESELRQNVDTTLKLIESIYLKTTKFIGSDQISIADISAYCEIKQMEFINFEYPKYEKIWAWMKRMEQIKQINEVHVKFNIISVKIKEKRKNFKEQTA